MALKKEFLVADPAKRLRGSQILHCENLQVNFKVSDGVLQAVRGVNLTVQRGQIVGIVGESGSGKSVCVKSLIGFNTGATTTADILNLRNVDLTKFKKRTWNYIRGTYIAYIPQDPLMSLNPTMHIGAQVAEAIKVSERRRWVQYKANVEKEPRTPEQVKKAYAEYKARVTPKAVRNRTIEILEFIGITNPETRLKAYPHEFSGGMRQRIVIAIAVATRPDVIIADEPTTALDVTIQAKVLDLIKKLRDQLNITIIFISHNIALVANFCDYIYIMYAGKILEQGKTEEIFLDPKHPYTWALMASIPDENAKGQKLASIPGTPPNLVSPPKGDAFASRNKYAMKLDFEKHPPMFDITPTHKAATWLLHPSAPKVQLPEEVQNIINESRASFALYVEKQKAEATKRLATQKLNEAGA